MTFSLLSRNVCIQLLILHILKSQTSLTARIFLVCLFVCFVWPQGFFGWSGLVCWGGEGRRWSGGVGGRTGCFGYFVVVVWVGLFLNTRSSVTTQMAEAFTEDSVVRTTEDF